MELRIQPEKSVLMKRRETKLFTSINLIFEGQRKFIFDCISIEMRDELEKLCLFQNQFAELEIEPLIAILMRNPFKFCVK